MNTQATALLPMQPMTSLPTWVLMAAQVYAPQQVVLVGAGNGTGPLVQGLLTMQGMPQHAGMKANLLDAHAPTLAQLAKRLGPDTKWQLSADVVLSTHGEANPIYHHYSLGTESSLLPPSDVQTLWPSLQLMSEQPASNGVPINRLLPSPWLLLDCLPAAHLLQGADLASTHVLLARVVLGAPNTSPSGSTLVQLQAQLGPQGYQLAACFAERNTQLAKTLWLRDPAWLQYQVKAQADQALSEQSKVHEAQVKSMSQELQALQAANHVAKEQLQAQLAAEVQAKRDLQAENALALVQVADLTKANEQSQTQLKALQAETQAQQQFNELTKTKEAELKEKVTETRDALEKALAAHHSERTLLSKEKVEILSAKEKVEKLSNERQAKIKLLEQRLQISQTNIDNAENRNRSFEVELFKAEAQIELIKAFVLKDSAQ